MLFHMANLSLHYQTTQASHGPAVNIRTQYMQKCTILLLNQHFLPWLSYILVDFGILERHDSPACFPFDPCISFSAKENKSTGCEYKLHNWTIQCHS